MDPVHLSYRSRISLSFVSFSWVFVFVLVVIVMVLKYSEHVGVCNVWMCDKNM